MIVIKIYEHKITDKCDEVNWDEVSNIFEVIDWGRRSPEILQLAFEKSPFFRIAYDGDKLIDLGRTVDDGAFYAWVVDLAILPEYQGKGVGSYILKELENDLKPFLTTMITVAFGKSGFYEKLGWLKQTAAYIWPHTKEQKRAFTEKY